VFIDGIPYLGATIGQRAVVAAYRVALDGKAAPRLLFVEEGVELQFSPRGAILTSPAAGAWDARREAATSRPSSRWSWTASASRAARSSRPATVTSASPSP
jgi:hypothetical protein